MARTSSIPVVSGAEADLAYAAAQRVVQTHQRIVEFLRVGQTLPQIDAEVARILESLDCRSAFLHYKISGKPAFPSHACLSLNSCVVHGTAASHDKPMAEGDLLKIDIGVVHRGWIGDAGWTYVFKRYPSDEAKRLMQAGKDSLARGVKRLQPGKPYIDWAREVQQCVEAEYGFKLVRGLGGHGIGRHLLKKKRIEDHGLHLAPFVSNAEPSALHPWPEALDRWTPGTLVAVEPMLAVSTTGTREDRVYKWPVYSDDGSLTVHYEHDVLITANGPRVLTEGMEKLPDIVG